MSFVTNAGNNSPEVAYQALLDEGELQPDPDQARVVSQFEQLCHALQGYSATPKYAIKSSPVSWLRTKFYNWLTRDRQRVPRGMYLCGGVGRGKSMLMDLFFSVAPVKLKRRVHFHEFMLDVHRRLNTWNTGMTNERVDSSKSHSRDPIFHIAQQITRESSLLCFDELQVTDIADAMVLVRLFKELFANGVVVVATSNRAPDELYWNGLNRQSFLPFIKQLKEELEVISLQGPTDYRYDRLQGVQTYYYPINEETTARLAEAFFRLTDRSIEDRAKVPSGELLVNGRMLFVPKAARGVAVFSFKRLCVNPLGSADYLAIARAYHTVIMVAIPQLGSDKNNEARRFVTLIDALYEHGVKLLCSAAVPPQLLYQTGEGLFEFERTVSRLMEMQSERYLSRGHGLDSGL